MRPIMDSGNITIMTRFLRWNRSTKSPIALGRNGLFVELSVAAPPPTIK